MSDFLYHDSMIYELSELAEYQQVWSAVETVLTDIAAATDAVSKADDPVALAAIANGGDTRYFERFKEAYGIPNISALPYYDENFHKDQGTICALLTERGRPYSIAFLDALEDSFDIHYYLKNKAEMYADYTEVVDDNTMTVDVLVPLNNSALKNAVFDLYRRIIPIEFKVFVHCPYRTYQWYTTEGYKYGDLEGDTYQNIREGIIVRAE